MDQDIARGAEARLLGSRRGTKPSYLNPTQGWRSRLTNASLSPVGSRSLLRDSKSTASIDGVVARDKTDGAGSVVGGSSVGGGAGGAGLGHPHAPSALSSRWNGNRSRRGSTVAAGEATFEGGGHTTLPGLQMLSCLRTGSSECGFWCAVLCCATLRSGCYLCMLLLCVCGTRVCGRA